MTNRCKKKLSNSLASREMQTKIMRYCFTSVGENKIAMTITYQERCVPWVPQWRAIAKRNPGFSWHSCQ